MFRWTAQAAYTGNNFGLADAAAAAAAAGAPDVSKCKEIQKKIKFMSNINIASKMMSVIVILINTHV